MRLALRVLLALGLLAAGVVVGGTSVAVHATWLGLALATSATAACSWALPGGWAARLPFGVGWVGVLAYVLSPRPEGDYLVPADVRGYLLMAFGLVLLLFSIVTVRPLRRVRDAPPGANTPPS